MLVSTRHNDDRFFLNPFIGILHYLLSSRQDLIIAISDHIARFPFPFPRDQYRYSTNVEPAGNSTDTVAGSWGDTRIAIDAQSDPLAKPEPEPSLAEPLRHGRP